MRPRRDHDSSRAKPVAEATQAQAVDAATAVEQGPGTADAVLALQRSHGNHAVARMLVQRQETAEKKKEGPPDYLVQHTFFGRGIGAGINKTLKDKLEKAEAHIRDNVYPKLPEGSKVNRLTGEDAKDYKEWAGIRSINGFRPGSFHGSGSAVDINAEYGPYIVTSELDKQGKEHLRGEAAGNKLVKQRQGFMEVMNRAAQWYGDGATVDLHARRKDDKGKATETTGEVYDRFSAASSMLSMWMMCAIRLDAPQMINRAVLPDVEDPSKVPDAKLEEVIPTKERMTKDKAIELINEYMSVQWWKDAHPNPWPMTAEQTYYRVLRDYEMSRIPMVSGAPSATPGKTRNPINGFIDFRREFVEAMCDVGKLRWGACDFPGASGDTHHFDLGFHPPDAPPVAK